MTIQPLAPIRSYISAEFTDALPRASPQRKPFRDLFSLRGKVAVVTGAAHGIGLAVAELYAEAGALVALVDISDSSAQAKKLALEYTTTVLAFRCNVANAEAVDATVLEIASALGTIDIFVANAGIVWKSGNLLSDNTAQTDKAWNQMMDVNVNGVYYCARAVGAIFKAHGRGSFIITASMSAQVANFPTNITPYNVSKAAVRHFAKVLAVEWAGFARVNSVLPGYCDTGLNDHLSRETRGKWWATVPLGREATPHEMSPAFLYLASDASSYVTGTDLVVDGGYTAI